MRATARDARTHLAWLMWCFDQGYTKAEDRAILTNWLLEDPATLNPEDATTRIHLLEMADEILALSSALMGDVLPTAPGREPDVLRVIATEFREIAGSLE